MRQVYSKIAVVALTIGFAHISLAQAQEADTTRIKNDIKVSEIDQLKSRNTAPILYGEQPKTTLLQSVSTVYSDQLTTTPSAQFLQALPGRLAGLNINFTSGGPGLDGNGMSFNIRGARAQVILIDGVERGYQSISPEQIESITVLKDALSTVMFGQRSSYGILSVITKKGDLGRPRISFTVQSGFESPTALPKALSAWQYATLYNEAEKNNAGLAPITPKYSQTVIDAYLSQSNPALYPDVDWYSTVLKKNAGITRYNTNLQGSGKGFRYFINLDKLTEKGLFKTSDINKYNTNSQLDRYEVRSNVGVDVTPTTFVQLNVLGRTQRYNQPGGTSGSDPNGVGNIFNALLTTPNNAYPVYNPDGTYGGSGDYPQNANIWGQAINRGYSFQDARDLAVDLEVTQKLDRLTKGLYAKVRGSNNNTVYFTTERSKVFEVYQYKADGTYTKYGTNGEQTTNGFARDRNRITYFEGSVGYDRSLGRHSISALALANQQSRLVFSSNNIPENYTAFAGRLNYSYNDKYIAEGALSYGKYNWLDPSKRDAIYWAAGLGWNIHNEAFLRNNVKAISNLKLRANYGITGQVNAGYFSYIQTYHNSGQVDNGRSYWYGTGSSLIRPSGEGSIATSNLGPEKAKKLDAGFDLGLLNNRFTVSTDYFYNKYYDLVASSEISTAIFGAGFPVRNQQAIDYWGTDITATWQSNIRNLRYYISGNFSSVQSELVVSGELPKNNNYQLRAGHQAGMEYGYTAVGLFKSYDEINGPEVAVFGARSLLRPGDIRYMDKNDDGVINSDDQSPFGNGKPAIYYGITLGFNVKGFDFSSLIQGTANRQSYVSGDFMNGFGNSRNAAYEYNLGRFTPETAETATQPRVWLGTNENNNLRSTFWLRNNDFVRLKNIEIGYTLPESVSHKIRASGVRVFCNGLNLLTFAEIHKIRDDMDPQSWGAAYPIMKVFNFGVNVKF